MNSLQVTLQLVHTLGSYAEAWAWCTFYLKMFMQVRQQAARGQYHHQLSNREQYMSNITALSYAEDIYIYIYIHVAEQQ